MMLQLKAMLVVKCNCEKARGKAVSMEVHVAVVRSQEGSGGNSNKVGIPARHWSAASKVNIERTLAPQLVPTRYAVAQAPR